MIIITRSGPRPPRAPGGAPKKTHCKRGHELAGDNVTESWTLEGYLCRHCKACARHHHYERKIRRILGARNSSKGAKEASC